MKICFYNVTATSIYGGLETYCWEAGRALSRRGHGVTIVAGDRGEARHRELALVQFPFRAEKEWPDFGVRFRRLAERLSFARHSLRHLIDAGYDAVIVNKPFDFPILWRARARGLRAQTLFRSGGTDFFLGDRCFAPAIDHWVSCSRFNAAQIAARYARKVDVIANGVDTAAFRPLGSDHAFRSRLGIAEDDVLAVSVGRLVGWKGLGIVIDALAKLGSGFQYLVVGEGPDEAGLRADAATNGLAERVHFLGRIEHDRLPQLLSQCDLFVQPSVGEEAFGISVVEAMACALPVYASDLGGLRETVVDRQTGRLLPQGDVPAWRDALAQAAAERSLLKRWGEAGRARAERDFSWANNAARLELLLDRRQGKR